MAKSFPDAYSSRRRLIRWVKNLPTDAAVREHVLRHLLGPKRLKPPYMEFSGLMIFDMGLGTRGCPIRRLQFGELGARMGNALDMADDVVDLFETAPRARADFLHTILATAITGAVPAELRTPHRAAYEMTRQLHRDVLCRDPERAAPLLSSLVEVNRRQCEEADPDALLELEVEAGALVVESIALLLEIEHGLPFPTAREACRRIGAYGQLLDNWVDVPQDLAEGVNTLGTAMIRQFGDSPDVQREIDIRYRERIDALDALLPRFDDEVSEAALGTMKSLLQFKYRNKARTARHAGHRAALARDPAAARSDRSPTNESISVC